MPEIKNTFIEGKMNKDLDERLVPKGQYINAMNVEVTTSEDSDVGTVQNIYGNIGIEGNNLIPPDSVCIGSVVDDATDSLYWLTATDKVIAEEGVIDDEAYSGANIIFQYNEDNSPFINPIFVDVHQVLLPVNLVTQPISASILYAPLNLDVHIGMSIQVRDNVGNWYGMGEITDIDIIGVQKVVSVSSGFFFSSIFS